MIPVQAAISSFITLINDANVILMDINLLYVAVNGDSCPDVPFFMHNICQPEKQGHFGRNKPNLEQQFDWFWFWDNFYHLTIPRVFFVH